MTSHVQLQQHRIQRKRTWGGKLQWGTKGRKVSIDTEKSRSWISGAGHYHSRGVRQNSTTGGSRPVQYSCECRGGSRIPAARAKKRKAMPLRTDGGDRKRYKGSCHRVDRVIARESEAQSQSRKGHQKKEKGFCAGKKKWKVRNACREADGETVSLRADL